MKKYKYEIVSQHGIHRSYHHTRAAAERQQERNLAWRCGICGSDRGGWGRCSHGVHNRVCSAEHFNNEIIDHTCQRCGTWTPGGGYCDPCREWMREH